MKCNLNTDLKTTERGETKGWLTIETNDVTVRQDQEVEVVIRANTHEINCQTRADMRTGRVLTCVQSPAASSASAVLCA